jgi:hypothetical protein
MVDSTSDAIIANPQAVITKIFSISCCEVANLDSSLSSETPSMTSDYDIPKSFESAFSDPTQLEKVLPGLPWLI